MRLWRVRIVRQHRPDSWTAGLLGEVLFVTAQWPHRDYARAIGSVVDEEVIGWDVDMQLLTVEQHQKLWRATGGLLVGDLFCPAECAEPVEPLVIEDL
jgi:hypothetical protein